MDKLNALLKPSWGSEKWILEGWQQLTLAEQEEIESRVNELFKEGLPFELKQDKLLYIYSFALLAQLEVLAIQVPLKFEASLSNPLFRKQLHAQLIDEIFHGIVFTKIVYLLASPYSMPPAYNENIETLCNFIRHEECPKVALMLLNLIAEGWIEEMFMTLQQHGIAPRVFGTIIADEQRHVSEADLYKDVGTPNIDVVQEKLRHLEEQLLMNLFLQYKYTSALSMLLGAEGMIDFMQSLDKKHRLQLKKVNLEPSEPWKMFMNTAHHVSPGILNYAQSTRPLPMSATRNVLMTQWDNPSDPTMVGEFNVDVSCLDFFNKTFPPETLTTLMLQTVSLLLTKDPSFRAYLSHYDLYTTTEAYVGVVVKLPDCDDHLGTIIVKNCHQLTMLELSQKIRHILSIMGFCYKARTQLEQCHPHLKELMSHTVKDMSSGIYPYPMPGNPVVSVSNIGACGYSHVKSPLRRNEGLKFTLLEVRRQMVWNKHSKEFNTRDLLPVSISADHRIFDGNLPIPKLIGTCFEQSFEQMMKDKSCKKNSPLVKEKQFKKFINQLLETNLELGYKSLTLLQTVWVDFMNVDELISFSVNKKMDEVL